VNRTTDTGAYVNFTVHHKEKNVTGGYLHCGGVLHGTETGLYVLASFFFLNLSIDSHCKILRT